MIIRVPDDTKNYMAELLESKIQSNKDECLFENIREYRQKYMAEDKDYVNKMTSFGNLKTTGSNSINPTANFGIGGGTGFRKVKKDQYKSPSIEKTKRIMFGDSDDEDAMWGGAGMYAGGALAAWLGSMAGKVGGKLGSMAQQLGGQIEDLTAKSLVDAQVAEVGRNQMLLQTKGMGSPWVPIYLPGKKKIDRRSRQEMEDEELGKKIRSTEIKQKARNLNIP
jgi:hypothetical protein